MSVITARHEAATKLISKVAEVEARLGVTREALEEIQTALEALAGRADLFPVAHFPLPPGAQSLSYRVTEAAGGRLALNVVHGSPGNASAVHNHHTWAAIAGISGCEQQVEYERTDNRSTEGQGTLRKTGEHAVVAGASVGYLPDEFHSIAVLGDEPALTLHLYGEDLEGVDSRIQFAGPDGGAYRTFATRAAATPRLGAAELDEILRDGEEVALLDVREEGAYGRLGHILLAVNVPLSQLELRLAALVPRLSTRTVVYDADGGWLSARAARRLRALGYTNVVVLDGGLEAWRSTGREVFTGANVVSKAFGEFIEDTYDTPRITPEELKAKLDRGEDLIVLDTRPLPEFTNISIPGGIDCPGAELVYRAHDLVRSPDTLVVVNCAGRTRAIIGTQALINAGFPNPVIGLENGTSGWRLAGFEAASGETAYAAPPSAEGLREAKSSAERAAKTFGVRYIDAATIAQYQQETERRTLYLFDVRTPEEYAAGHLPGSRWAAGGQVVQALDQYVGTQGARIVLLDDADGVRATFTASWLIQIGLDDVEVFAGLDALDDLHTGPDRARVLGVVGAGDQITPEALAAVVAGGGTTVIDLAKSPEYAGGHIPGAWFAVRARLVTRVANLPGTGPLVLTSPDGVLAGLTAAELAGVTTRPVVVLTGGTAAWREAGLDLEVGLTSLADEVDDSYAPPTDLEERRVWYADYVRWGREVVGKIERDGSVRFRSFV
jgi:rhodanese-related sulfurtransferase/predicted metal-dependent enzyme (double-stranded beta helix superfamily)